MQAVLGGDLRDPGGFCWTSLCDTSPEPFKLKQIVPTLGLLDPQGDYSLGQGVEERFKLPCLNPGNCRCKVGRGLVTRYHKMAFSPVSFYVFQEPKLKDSLNEYTAPLCQQRGCQPTVLTCMPTFSRHRPTFMLESLSTESMRSLVILLLHVLLWQMPMHGLGVWTSRV